MVFVPFMPGHMKRLPFTMVKLLKPAPGQKYVDLVICLQGDNEEDVACPPVRYFFGLWYFYIFLEDFMNCLFILFYYRIVHWHCIFVTMVFITTIVFWFYKLALCHFVAWVPTSSVKVIFDWQYCIWAGQHLLMTALIFHRYW